jgi:ABC-2 type transport system permease protein
LLIPWAFIKRDYLTNVSYRASFAMQFVGILFQVAVFYFISQVFGSAVSPTMQAYGGSYFAFLLVGTCFSDYLGLSLHAFSSNIRESQSNGTLELMLLSPTRLSNLLLSSSLWGYLFTSVRVAVYLVAGVIVFGVRLESANPLAALATFLLSVVCFASLGIISASFVVVLKRGDPITWLVGSASGLLAGVYYPVEVLPDWLQVGSALLPMTYSLNAMRLALLRGFTIAEIAPYLITLALFTLVLLPLGLWSFRSAIRRAKMQGSLAQF